MSPKSVVDFYDDQGHPDGDTKLYAREVNRCLRISIVGLTTAATMIQSSQPMFLTTHFLTIIRSPTTMSATTVTTMVVTMMPACLLSSREEAAVVVSIVGFD